MTMKKRFLSLLLAAGVVAAALPLGAFAEVDEEGIYQLTVDLPSTQTEELGTLPAGAPDGEKKSTHDPSAPYGLTSEGNGVFHFYKNVEGEGMDPATKRWLDGTWPYEDPDTVTFEQILEEAKTERRKRAEAYWEKAREIEIAVIGSEDLSDVTIEQAVEIQNRVLVELGPLQSWRASGEEGPALSQEMLLHLCVVGIMEGGDGSFQLDRPVTQGEFVKMTVAALGQDPEETAEGTFWAEGYVKKALSDGWLTVTAEEFDYNKTVSWQEAEAMLARAMGRESVSDLDLSQGAAVDFAEEPLFRNQTAVIFCNFLEALADAENQ